jgi:hypothetical protein
VGKAQPRKPRLKKAIDAHAAFVGRDGDILHGCRKRDRRKLSLTVILGWPPTGPARSGRPDDKLRGLRRMNGRGANRHRLVRFRDVRVRMPAKAGVSAAAPPEFGLMRFRILI